MDCSFQILASNVKKFVTIESQYRFTILFFFCTLQIILKLFSAATLSPSLFIYILTIKWQLVKSIKPST
jgi:hypothetical protein